MAEGQAQRTDAFIWDALGETSTAYTTPAVDERDYVSMKTNHPDAVFYTNKPYRWNGAAFRFITDADANAYTVDMFASKGKKDSFTKIATLTLAGGKQVGPDATGVFVDTISVSDAQWKSTITVVDGAGADRIASLYMDALGFDTFAFVATAVSTTLTVEATGY
jgi:hypothetical protein